jgi:hypothetical protein
LGVRVGSVAVEGDVIEDGLQLAIARIAPVLAERSAWRGPDFGVYVALGGTHIAHILGGGDVPGRIPGLYGAVPFFVTLDFPAE